MEVTVNEQLQRFHLAFSDGWKSIVGHEIKVGKYRFCATPTEELIIISEITTGAKLLELPINFGVMMTTATKEGAIEFFEGVGKQLIPIIKRHDFDQEIERHKQISLGRLGEMPAIEKVDI
ncbi:hypothetical protein [Sporosarcina sp. FA9]|uniref:hypothetical protein n=1 Tax=Sporosarcina sp. FA9 TaxID=3413030 RepID=UPI003F65E940